MQRQHLSLFVVLALAAFVPFGVRGAVGARASGGCTASAGAASPYPANNSTQGQLVAPDNRNRTFTVYVPPGYRSDRPSAVVLLFHGGFGTGQQAQKAYKMDETAEANNFIVVYPDGWRVSALTSWNGGACCNPSANLGVDDVGFVSALLDHLEASLCIDTSAVFAAGMSNGAIMSYRLACELSHRLAAIAPVAGVLEFSPCTPSRPVPVLAVHGLADLNVPFEGGFGCGAANVNFTSVPASIDVMAAANGCSCRWLANGSCATTYLVEGHGSCLSYGPCEGAKVDVVLCSVEGNGHAWPGASDGMAGEGCNNTAVADFHTNTHIWAFFNATRTTASGGGEMSSANTPLLHAMWQSVHAWLF